MYLFSDPCPLIRTDRSWIPKSRMSIWSNEYICEFLDSLLIMHSNLFFGLWLRKTFYQYTDKKSTLMAMVIYNLAFSQRSVYPYSWWNILFLSFRRGHPHGEFGDQEWLQPQTIHTRWSRRYVIKTSRSKRFFKNFCVLLFRNTSDQCIVWSVMGTCVAVVCEMYTCVRKFIYLYVFM